MNTVAISESVLYHLIRTGYVTLQIPNITVEFYSPVPLTQTPPPAQDIIQIPEDWINTLKYDSGYMRPCIGKESGFIYFTEKGYIECKDKIKDAFLDAFRNGRSRGTNPTMTEHQAWTMFDTYAQDHFKKVRLSIAKYQKKLQDQIADSSKMVV